MLADIASDDKLTPVKSRRPRGVGNHPERETDPDRPGETDPNGYDGIPRRLQRPERIHHAVAGGYDDDLDDHRVGVLSGSRTTTTLRPNCLITSSIMRPASSRSSRSSGIRILIIRDVQPMECVGFESRYRNIRYPFPIAERLLGPGEQGFSVAASGKRHGIDGARWVSKDMFVLSTSGSRTLRP